MSAAVLAILRIRAGSWRESRLASIQELLLRLLRQRFGQEVDGRVEQRIAAASFDQIEAWSARVLSTATLAEVLTD